MELLKPKQVAELLGVTTQTIKLWADSGKIDVQKTLGGHRRIPRGEVERLLGRKLDE